MSGQSPTDPVDAEMTETLPGDGRIKGIMSQLLPELKKALTELKGSDPGAFTPLSYRVQEDPCSDELDTNFFIKIQYGENEVAHAKIAQHPDRRLSLCKLAAKTKEDEIEQNL